MELARLPLAGNGGLVDVLRTVRDPRRRNGMRHPGRALLAAAVCAVLSGCRSVKAIAEWTRDQPEAVRRTLGFNRKEFPSETTFRTYLLRRGIHLTGLGAGSGSPRAVDARQLHTGGLAAGFRRQTWHLAGALRHDELTVSDGVVTSGEFK